MYIIATRLNHDSDEVVGDLPAKLLLRIIRELSAAPGQKCEFGHVEVKADEAKTVVDYERETNPMKGVANDAITLCPVHW